MIKIKINPHDKTSVLVAAAVVNALMAQLGVDHPATKAEFPQEAEPIVEGGPDQNPPEVTEEEAAKKAKRSAAAKKAAETRRLKKEAEEAQEAQEAEETSTTTNAAPTLDDLRDILALKGEDHFDAIVKKLSSFGVKNLSSLPEEHFVEMNNFLTAL